jgi:sugar lactone lactonase YvrE
LLLARGNGFAALERDGTLTELADVEPGRVENRMNDGKCDPAGRFWAGSIFLDKNAAEAALYRLDDDLTTRVMRTGVTVSNGLGWSPDASAMYYIDSLAGGVDVYAVDNATGEISDRRRFVDIPFEHGEPDGLTVDASGCVWFAIWRAGEVRRYTPTGELDTIVNIPASLSTSCCFGGVDLDTLFVTSARCDLTPDQLDAQPHAGAIFACRPGTTGLPSTPFAGLLPAAN